MPPLVLLIEDNEADVLLFERAASGSPFLLRVASDGEAALRELDRAPLPDLILLDLKLPRKSGLEILEGLGARSDLRELPVVALTSSSEMEDVRNAYRLGVRAYVVKPVGFDQLRTLVAAVAGFLGEPARGAERCFGGLSLPRPAL
jgi:CheY-like chemotaxis protein